MPTVAAPRAVFAEDHDAFRDTVRRFIAAEVDGSLADWRRDQLTPPPVVAAAGGAGFLGITAAEEFGGADIDDRGFLTVLIEETIASGATGLALLWALHAGIAVPALSEHGTPEARRRWLPGLVSGERICVPAPPGAVSLEDGRLSGELLNVPFGRVADLLIVAAPGAGTVLVATDQPAVQVAAVTGNLAAPDAGLADITVSGVEVDPADVLAGTDSLRRELNLWFAVISSAAARSALRLAIDYTRERKVFGRPLAEFENTRLRLAELVADTHTVTAYVDHCVTEGRSLGAGAATVAHLTAARLHDRCADQALQLHGGYGYMREYPVSTAFADARFLRLLAQQYTDVGRTVADDLGL